MLLSSGVPVEVCRVSEIDKAKSAKALEKLRKRMKAGEMAATKARDGVSNAAQDYDDLEGAEEDDEEEGDDEWKYESGEEGRSEGRWAKGDELEERQRKRTKR